MAFLNIAILLTGWFQNMLLQRMEVPIECFK